MQLGLPPGNRVKVDPDELHSVAGHMRARADDFVADSPPDVNGDWPSHQATQEWHGAVQDTSHQMHRRMNDMADTTSSVGDGYTQTDQQNVQTTGSIKPQDATAIFTSTFKDLASALSGGIGPLMSGLAGGSAAVGSAAASAAGALANAAAGQSAVRTPRHRIGGTPKSYVRPTSIPVGGVSAALPRCGVPGGA